MKKRRKKRNKKNKEKGETKKKRKKKRKENKRKKIPRADTRLPQSCAGEQKLYLRSLEHLGSEAKDRKNVKKQNVSD